MINKVFKTILILSLCLGITLPANAAGVDVSDGAAFITKSELSYSLNNLSARMTALENSLDSKIDALVSSYLTRNGIWNGSKQTLTTASGVTFRYGFTRGIQLNMKSLNVVIDKTMFTPNYYWGANPNNMGEIILANTARTVDIINSVNKSGLLLLKTSIGNYRQSSQTRAGYSYAPLNKTPGTTSYSTNANGDHFAFIYSQDFIFLINGTKEGGRRHAEFIAVASNAALRCPAVPAGSVIFFVNKGDKISVKDEPLLLKGDYTDFAATLSWWYYTDNAYSTYDYKINEAYIY